MLRKLLNRYLQQQALVHGRKVRLWRRIGRPSRAMLGEYYRIHGGFAAFGTGCEVSEDTVFTDPYLTRVGDRVRFAGAWVSCHDGSINTVNAAYGTKFDAVGPVTIGSDVFVGVGVRILPNTTIGDRSVVAAGAIVAGRFPPESVIAGIPAKRIRSMEEHVERLRQRNAGFPWRDLVEERTADNYWTYEQELRRRRAMHFFGD